jgi:very-short-patch-repair endonuclease
MSTICPNRPTPNPSRKREGDCVALLPPIPLAGGAGGGQECVPMAKFKNRDTHRARELRNAATPAERKLWEFLRKRQAGAKFCRQMQVGSFFPDFLCREHKLIVELDGHSHDVSPGRDVWRDRYFVDAGYRVMHFTNDDVFQNVEGVVTAIQLELKRLAHP